MSVRYTFNFGRSYVGAAVRSAVRPCLSYWTKARKVISVESWDSGIQFTGHKYYRLNIFGCGIDHWPSLLPKIVTIVSRNSVEFRGSTPFLQIFLHSWLTSISSKPLDRLGSKFHIIPRVEASVARLFFNYYVKLFQMPKMFANREIFIFERTSTLVSP